MRIVQVVSVISPDNRYGGPTTVALNQCRALTSDGHEVILLAGAIGYAGALPRSVSGVDVRMFPVRQLVPGAGFAGISAPAMLPYLRRLIVGADAVHVHLARDLLTLPAAYLALRTRVRYAVQTHGMVDPSKRPLARPVDRLLTRPVLRQAETVFYLTALEARQLREVAGSGIRLRELPNGIERGLPAPTRHSTGPVEVLYLARLHARKRPEAFIDAARTLASRFPGATFRMIGPDEGEGSSVIRAIHRAGLGDRLRWDGPAAPAAARKALDQADLYVLPSIDEPYPMSVLEAMRAGLPVVVTDSCGLAPMIKAAGAGTVVDGQPASLIPAIHRYLEDGEARLDAGRRASALIASRFTMAPVTKTLVESYSGQREKSCGFS